ncbi:MAG: long-chain fatty acid--CoA ligase [Thermoanaerobaculia bacterium]|nr:long-chain fatty acid--CoA ligase [Thermoanaerobaculia bacterium]
MAIGTLSELYLVSQKHDKSDCLLHKVDGQWVPVSTAELSESVRRLMSALDGYGVRSGDRVALMAENGVHWPAVDFATLCNGAILVPIYPTLTADQAAYVIDDCGAEIVFVQGRERLEGLLEERGDMPQVKQFVLIDGASPDASIPTLDELLAASEPVVQEELERRARRVGPDELATFIYTSGTTGKPKGVMLSHGNIASNVIAALEAMDIEPHYTALSFLPLSHSFERTVDYIYFYRGVTIAYAESVQLVAQNLQEVKPHVFVSVPRVYEKVLAKVQENVSQSSPVKQKIFNWAVAVAREAVPYRLKQQSPPGLLGVKLALADKLVFGKIRDRLGGRFEFAMSGGAPLSAEIARFFWGAGIRIYEGYGLSETSPVLTVNSSSEVKLGTVGPAIPGVELAIAEDGEILARGPNIMKGYYNLPEETAEAIDNEGWFHTGDIGEIDEEGFLKITDRKKELIVNAYGKNIAPAPIENHLKTSRFIEQAVVIGDQRKFLSALLVPDLENLASWATRQGFPLDSRQAAADDDRVRALIGGEVAKVNAGLARYEQIHAWRLLPAEFTIEGGELTPTQKVKRRVVTKKYADEIERLYREAEGRAAS